MHPADLRIDVDAQLEYIDIWRTLVVAFFSYIAMAVVAIVLSPLIFVPVVNIFLGAIILGLGMAFAAKIVLSCDWQPAWTVGISAVVMNLLVSWIFSGCA